jgi:predicted metal-dependent hydrolase
MNAAPIQEKTQAKTKWKDSQELKDAVQQWGDHINVQVKQIQLRPMKRKWASISTTGRLTVNTELLDLPKELGEFVIVHELVHLLVPNHGKVFKCFMFAYLPDWEELEQRLRNLAS